MHDAINGCWIQKLLNLTFTDDQYATAAVVSHDLAAAAADTYAAVDDLSLSTFLYQQHLRCIYVYAMLTMDVPKRSIGADFTDVELSSVFLFIVFSLQSTWTDDYFSLHI